MSIKKWIGMGLCGLIASTGVSFAQGDMMAQIDEAFKAGTLKGNLGVHYMNFDDETVNHESLAAGFLEMEYMTGSYEGLQLGVDVLGVGELMDDDNAIDLDFQNYYNNDDMDAILRELYVKYSMMDSSIVVGRHQPMTPPMLDGDAYRGVTLNIGEWTDMGIMVCASVFDRWIDDATFDDGVTGWVDMDDMANDAGDALYSVMANFEVMDKMVDVKPYMLYQSDFASVYGIQAGMDYEIEGGMVGATADFYTISEDVAFATDDSSAWKLYAMGEMDNISGGIGYFQFSDDAAQLTNAGWLDDLTVMDDEIAELLGGSFNSQGAECWWIDLGYEWEGLTLAAQYGSFEDDVNNEYDQWLLKASYDVSESLSVTGEYVDGDDDGAAPMEVTLFQLYGVYSF